MASIKIQEYADLTSILPLMEPIIAFLIKLLVLCVCSHAVLVDIVRFWEYQDSERECCFCKKCFIEVVVDGTVTYRWKAVEADPAKTKLGICARCMSTCDMNAQPSKLLRWTMDNFIQHLS